LTWIKICGNTSLGDAITAVDAGADALGFIFAPSSRRIDPAAARAIISFVPRKVEKIGVFVNEAPERVAAIAADAGLDWVQLHGDEDAGYASRLRSELQGKASSRVLKAIAVRAGVDKVVAEIIASGAFDGVLLDSPPAPQENRGGTGRVFDWNLVAEILPRAGAKLKIVVGGGLTPLNAGDAVQKLRPWGVDVCSGVELSPGRKDTGKIKAFLRAVRGAEGT
jgi:phosphoribosylanthranilate isomerase